MSARNAIKGEGWRALLLAIKVYQLRSAFQSLAIHLQ